MYRYLFISVVFVLTLYAGDACWKIMDRSELAFSEMDDVVTFSFKDSDTCGPITDAEVFFMGKTWTTNYDGEIKLPMPSDDVEGNLSMEVKKDKYLTLRQKIKTSIGTFWQNKFLMTKNIPLDSVKLILVWNAEPTDLDLHLVSDDFHLSYRNKEGVGYKATLDRDSTRGFGAETITLNKIDEDKTYKVFVHNFSDDGYLDSSVNLSLYKNSKIDKVVNLGKRFRTKCVQLAEISNKKVTYDIKSVDNKECK